MGCCIVKKWTSSQIFTSISIALSWPFAKIKLKGRTIRVFPQPLWSSDSYSGPCFISPVCWISYVVLFLFIFSAFNCRMNVGKFIPSYHVILFLFRRRSQTLVSCSVWPSHRFSATSILSHSCPKFCNWHWIHLSPRSLRHLTTSTS